MEPACPLPDCANSVYTRCYCEENIYWLIKRFLTPSGGGQPEWDVFSVFISNPTRTVALWNQRGGPSRGTPVIWDYHVILAVRERLQLHSQPQGCSLIRVRSTWVYDLDTCLPIPCHWSEYVDQTFPLGTNTPFQYQSRFRVIPGDVYLDNFASDRSHMLRVSGSNPPEEPRYLSQPPPYRIICGSEAEKHGIRNNLMTCFVSMGSQQGFGTVMDFDAFTTWCSFSEPVDTS
ncbi:N-terminal glutamine amidase-domain-containing protein [Boletus coccyginus]|nr:N-terminal glutamine amidase-domain-containing protein [Boletus coccyginus]